MAGAVKRILEYAGNAVANKDGTTTLWAVVLLHFLQWYTSRGRNWYTLSYHLHANNFIESLLQLHTRVNLFP